LYKWWHGSLILIIVDILSEVYKDGETVSCLPFYMLLNCTQVCMSYCVNIWTSTE
jgi:hypothetical protein